MAEDRLIIFVKSPRPGFVKSRLAASIGPEAAAEAYRTLVNELLINLTIPPPSCGRQFNKALTPHSALRTPHSIQLHYTPDDALAEIQPWLQPDWTASPQGSGTLGERMQRAFLDAFAGSARRVALIGSDCPTVSMRDVEEAWTALASHDLVLGPATDGGYWLIGLRRTHSELFEEMPWSTETVFDETLRRAAKLGLRVELLSPRTDVDTEQDWHEFLRAARTN